MSVAEKIGSFDLLSIWNLSPVMAALIVLAADFGMVNLLMCIEGYPRRGRYLNFIVNDLVLYPIGIAMVVVMLRQGTPSDGAFYLDPLWHWACLLVPLAVSIGMEIAAVRNGIFRMAQEVSPSKLWHTLIFAVMGYWIIAPIPAVLDVVYNGTAPGWAAVAWGLCAIWAIRLIPNGRVVYPFVIIIEPHVEWSWKRLNAWPVLPKH